MGIRVRVRYWLGNERGSTQIFLILTIVTLVVIVGLVVDGAGKTQAATHAQQVAASAARAATSALAAEAVSAGTVAIDPMRAEALALAYVDRAGLTGTVEVDLDAVSVHVESSYDTAFLGLIGISTLPVSASATAWLLDAPGAP